jgi:hypothetical protein
MIRKMFKNIVAQKEDQRRAELYRNLIRHEAKIGGELFGPVPAGGRREFFCLDEHTWVWHEEWVDRNGQHQSKTTRYDVRPNGILKSQNGQYQQLSADEARNLRGAVVAYRDKVRAELYSFVA